MFLLRASELKEEGNKHYTSREHKKALACYEQARAAGRAALALYPTPSAPPC